MRSPVVVLLPPSESKRPGGSGDWAPPSGRFAELGPGRADVAAALAAAMTDPAVAGRLTGVAGEARRPGRGRQRRHGRRRHPASVATLLRCGVGAPRPFLPGRPRPAPGPLDRGRLGARGTVRLRRPRSRLQMHTGRPPGPARPPGRLLAPAGHRRPGRPRHRRGRVGSSPRQPRPGRRPRRPRCPHGHTGAAGDRRRPGGRTAGSALPPISAKPTPVTCCRRWAMTFSAES